MHGHAARAPGRQRLAPAGLARGQVQHAEVTGMALQQLGGARPAGSRPAARASSSRKVSVEYAVCVLPTERHHSTGTPTVVVCSSTAMFGMA